MALIKMTAIVDSISGKLNGSVFARNKGGAYVRSKSVVSNPNTPLQQAVRSVFSAISQAWRDLTTEERKSWNEAVEYYKYTNVFGDLRTLSGKALFQKLNGNRLNVGLSIDSTVNAPTDVIGIARLSTELSIAVGTNAIEFTADLPQPLEDSQYFVLEATPSLSQGIDNAANRFRKVAVANLAAAVDSMTQADFATLPETLWGLYTAKFGTPQEGAKVFLRIKPINMNGQAGPYFTTSCIVGA
ncbi:MAG TPA: HMG-box domain-containing protein [Bacteroidia bacterium]|nr:HMG-box domain-containing protein [Bacteroidia bacterium]